MPVEGFVEYKRREFCKDVRCRVQEEMNKQNEGSDQYEKLRKQCGSGCLYTTWQFHHWLIEKGYLLLVSAELGAGERTVLVNLDKKTADWVDEQVAKGKFRDRGALFSEAVRRFRSARDV